MRTLCLAMGLLLATPALGMIGWEHAPGKVDLYRIDAGRLVRSTCPAGAVAFDPATCATDVRRAPLAGVLDAASAAFGAQIPTCQSASEAEAARLQRIDLRLLELLSWSPDDAAPELAALQARIDGLVDQELTQAAADSELRNQIALIEQRLGAASADELALLASLRVREQAAGATLQATRTELSSARDELVRNLAANGGDDEFRGLQAQRAHLVDDFNAQGHCIAAGVQERVDFTKALQLLANAALDYEVSSRYPEFAQYAPAMTAIAAQFAQRDGIDDVIKVLRYGSTIGSHSGTFWDVRFGLPVTAPDLRFKTIACEARYENDPVGASVPCSLIRVHAPGGVFALDTHREIALDAPGRDLAAEIPGLAAYTGPTLGTWTVTMQCYSPIASDPGILSSCELTLLQ